LGAGGGVAAGAASADTALTTQAARGLLCSRKVVPLKKARVEMVFMVAEDMLLNLFVVGKVV